MQNRRNQRMRHSHRHRSSRQSGGAPVLPSEYFGRESGSYSPTVAPSYSTAYGDSLGVSQGMLHGNMAGPNLAYGPTTSLQQTGGNRHRHSTNCRHRNSGGSRSSVKKSHKSRGRKSHRVRRNRKTSKRHH